MFNAQVSFMEEITICIRGIRPGSCPTDLSSMFAALGLEVLEIHHGGIRLRKPFHVKLEVIDHQLRSAKYEWIKDKQGQLVERVKSLAILMLRNPDFQKSRLKASHYLSKELGRSYAHISRVFSKVEGMTIEHYLIEQRITVAKELLLYEGCTLVEVSMRLGYSSVQHLSRQFHQITGETVRQYLQESANQNP